MNRNQKKRQLNRGLTIAIALLLTATICITIIALVSSKRSKPGESSSTSSTVVTTTSGGTTQTTPISSTSEKPVDKPVNVMPDSFSCPVSGGKLGKDYSSDVPVWSLTMEDYRVHSGIDIESDAGTAVFACADGEITEVYADVLMGQTVVVKHSDTCVSVYRNLQTKLPENIKVGATVKEGNTIGYVGDTALLEISDSPHLHFEILCDGKNVNPLSFFSVPLKDSEENFEDK